MEISDDVNEIPPTVILVAKLYENIALQREKETRRVAMEIRERTMRIGYIE